MNCPDVDSVFPLEEKIREREGFVENLESAGVSHEEALQMAVYLTKGKSLDEIKASYSYSKKRRGRPSISPSSALMVNCLF